MVRSEIDNITEEVSQIGEDKKLATKIWGNKVIVDRCFREIKKTGNLGKDAQLLEEMLQSIDIEDIQKVCLKIKEYEEKNLGNLQPLTSEYIREFGQRHEEVCYYLAGLKPWGQE